MWLRTYFHLRWIPPAEDETLCGSYHKRDALSNQESVSPSFHWGPVL